MTLILEENPTSGYTWDYDEYIGDDLYEVESVYVPDAKCKGLGCGGARHFTISPVAHEGDGIFFVCNVPDGEWVEYDVMENDEGCYEIDIRVEPVKKRV